MSLATLSGHNVATARVELPAFGIWYADVATEDAAAFPLGSAVTLTIAGLVLAGRAFRGEVYQGAGGYRIEGGAGGWRLPVRARSHQDDSGVRLAHVLAAVLSDMPAASRESFVGAPVTGGAAGIPAAADRSLGDHWMRRAGVASSSLALLAVPWYMRPDGATYCGARPSGAVADPQYDVTEPVDPGARRVTIATERPELWVPGLTLTDPHLASPLLLRHVTIAVDSDTMRIEVTG
jgi:hypothetical protein